MMDSRHGATIVLMVLGLLTLAGWRSGRLGLLGKAIAGAVEVTGGAPFQDTTATTGSPPQTFQVNPTTGRIDPPLPPRDIAAPGVYPNTTPTPAASAGGRPPMVR